MAGISHEDAWRADVLAEQLRRARSGVEPNVVLAFAAGFGALAMLMFWFGNWDGGMVFLACAIFFPLAHFWDERRRARKQLEIAKELHQLGASWEEIDALR